MVTEKSILIKNWIARFNSLFHYMLDPIHREVPTDYLSIVACIKDEGPYLKEWIEYHKLIGVTRFYLYDAATDNSKEVLTPYINDGLVVYHLATERGCQTQCYNAALSKYRYKSRWMAFIDVDEFIVSVTDKKYLPDFLKDYESYPALGINWITYDSNGHVSKPDGLVIKNYTCVHSNPNIWENTHIKSIVNPRKTVCYLSGHEAFYNPFSKSKYAVDENCDIILGGGHTIENHTAKIRINHYYSKSKEEYLKKCGRGNVDSLSNLTYSDESVTFADPAYDGTMEEYVSLLDEKLDVLM